MAISEALSEAEQHLKKVGIKTARLDALVLLEYVSRIDRSWLLAHGNRSMSQDTQSKFNIVIKQRAARIPLAYITKNQEFWGLSLKVTPDVLIPRPETEALVEQVLMARFNLATQISVLDVGTGSGAIAIAISKERPKWKVSASDISLAALKIAQSNAKKHEAKINFIKSDLFENVVGSFDIITANLPYVKDNAKLEPELKAEPADALFGGHDGLNYYRHFFDQVSSHLNKHGRIIIEANPEQHQRLVKLAEQSGLKLETDERFALTFSR